MCVDLNLSCTIVAKRNESLASPPRPSASFDPLCPPWVYGCFCLSLASWWPWLGYGPLLASTDWSRPEGSWQIQDETSNVSLETLEIFLGLRFGNRSSRHD